MRGRRLIALCCAPVLALALAPVAGATPEQDFYAVFKTWQDEAPFPHCKFTRKQFQNAIGEARKVGDFDNYAPTFVGAVQAEIGLIDARRCRGIARPPSARELRRSALRRVTIVGIHPRGGERIVLRNNGGRAVNLAGATLRDRSGRRVRLRGTIRGRRARAFRSRGVWDNSGDMVKLADRRGLVVRQLGFGSFEFFVRF